MSGSLNRVMLIGNLGKDPEVKNTQDGRKIVNMTIATSESWKDKNSGERKERTEWVRIVVFNEKLAEIAEKYLKKGSKVYIDGALQTRKWTDQSGVERYSTEVVLQQYRGEIVMLGDKSGGRQGRDDDGQDDFGSSSNRSAPRGRSQADLDDEIPF